MGLLSVLLCIVLGMLLSSLTTILKGGITTTTSSSSQMVPRQQQEQNLQERLEKCAQTVEERLSMGGGGTTITTTTTNNNNHDSSGKSAAAICAIQKGGLYYLDEWVDYHLALGFETIFLYDNSDDYELKSWATSRNPNQVVVRHFPGDKQQKSAYKDCLQQQQIRNTQQEALSGQQQQLQPHYEWLAFIDIDEFIVLKQHDNIEALLDDVIPSKRTGGLALHRLTFLFDPKDSMKGYEPIPVTKRFQTQLTRGPDGGVKAIGRTQFLTRPDIHLHHFRGEHSTRSENKHGIVDTAGQLVEEAYPTNQPNPHPIDVAVIHHYQTYSLDEYRSKCQRGDAVFGKYKGNPSSVAFLKTQGNQDACKPRDQLLERFLRDMGKPNATAFNDDAWQFLKKAVPIYARYNAADASNSQLH